MGHVCFVICMCMCCLRVCVGREGGQQMCLKLCPLVWLILNAKLKARKLTAQFVFQISSLIYLKCFGNLQVHPVPHGKDEPLLSQALQVLASYLQTRATQVASFPGIPHFCVLWLALAIINGSGRVVKNWKLVVKNWKRGCYRRTRNEIKLNQSLQQSPYFVQPYMCVSYCSCLMSQNWLALPLLGMRCDSYIVTALIRKSISRKSDKKIRDELRKMINGERG